MYDAALNVSRNDFSAFQSGYFQTWAYQTPFVLYEALLLRLFGNPFAIEFMNVIFMVGTNLLIYFIVKLIANEKIALVIALLYAFYPAPIFFSSLLTNQHISTFFIYLGIYLAMKSKNWEEIIFSGISLSLGNLMRPEGIVILCSFILVWILILCHAKRKNKCFSIIKSAALFLVSYFAISAITNSLITGLKINQNGISNQCPEWKFVVGLDNTTDGIYTERNADILQIKDPSIRKQKTLRIIKSSFKNCDNVWTFLYNKTKLMWASNETTSWTLQNYNHPLRITVILAIDKAIYLFVFILLELALMGEIKKFFDKTHKMDSSFLLILTVVLGYFTVYALIEIQTRYRYNIMPAVFIAASCVFLETGLQTANKSCAKKNSQFRSPKE